MPRRDHVVARLDHRAAAPGEAARAAGAVALVEPAGVALDDADRLDRQAEPVAEHLGISGLVPLPVRLGADRGLDDAVAADADVGEFLGRAATGDLDIISDPAAVAQPLGGRRRLARGEPGPVGARQRLVEHGGEVADVEGQAEPVGVRQLVGAEQVAAADLVGADPQLARRRLEQALHDVRCLGPAGAAIGVDRRGVGDDAVDEVVDRRDAVHPAEDAPAGNRLDRRAELRLIGAEVAPRLDLQRGDQPVGVEADGAVADHRPAVGVGLEGVAPLAGPLDRPAEVARGVQHQPVFGIEEGLHAEAAADVAGADAHLPRLDAHDAGQHLLRAGDALPAEVEGEAVALVPMADRGANLHRRRRDAVLDDAQPRDVGGGGEAGGGLVGVAQREGEQVVRRRVGPDLRCVRRQRLGERGHGGQLVVIDHHRLRPGPRRLAAVGDDEGDPVADEAGDVAGQQRARRRQLPGKGHQAGNDAVGGDVGVGVDRDDAGDRARLGRVDPGDAGMAIGRAHRRGEQHAGRMNVVGEAAPPGQQAEILDALGRLADPELHPRLLLLGRCIAG